MEKTYSEYTVSSADVDMNRRIRAGGYINIFIQAAIESADTLGFGFRGLAEENLFWVLSRMTVEIERPLHWYDRVKTETWPKDIDRLLYLRDFLVRDAEGTVTARATSGWLAVDLAARRPKKVSGTEAEAFTKLKNYHAIKEPPEKVADVTTGKSWKVKAAYFDIDLNRHVTATRYIDWMMDTFGSDFHENRYPKSISVNYIKEILPDQEITLFRRQAGEDNFLFQGVNDTTGNVSFRGRINFSTGS
ncbi:MAG: acyl-[acyl-carrier-protein] thioesterase [Spirochaetia bacterium]